MTNFAVSEVSRDSRNQLTACVTAEAPHGFVIANANKIPPEAEHDRKSLLFSYNPEGQHCHYIDADRIVEVTTWGSED